MAENPIQSTPAAPRGFAQDLAQVLESISDAFFALDRQWNFIYLNTAAERLLARRRQDLLGRNVWQEFPEAAGSVFQTQCGRAVSERTTAEFEAYFPPLDCWLAVRAYPTPSGLSVYFQNVDQRRRTERALRQSEERAREAADRLNLALAAAELGDWDWDADSDLIRMSPRAAEIFGVAVDKPLKRSDLRELLDPADRERARIALEQSPDHQGRYKIEYRVNRGDGKQVWVLANGLARVDAQGRMIGMAGVVQQVDDQHNAAAALRDLAEKLERQSRLFEQIASTTPDFIYVFDLSGRFLYANRRLLEVLGTTFEQAAGKSLAELGYPQWHADLHMHEIQQVIQTREPIKGQVPFTGGSGISGVYEYILTPVLNPQGEVEVIAGTTRDVTDRQRIEQEGLALATTLEASLARWQAVVASMSEGVVMVDPQGNLLDMNRAALDMHGYTDPAEVRQPLAKIAPSFVLRTLDDQVIPLEQWPIPRLLRGEAFRNCEIHLTRSEPPVDRIVNFTGVPMRDREGKITLGLLTLHDVTEERRAKQSLLESEARFREIFEQTPIGMTLNDTNGRYLHVNPAYCRIIGYSADDLLQGSLDFRDLIHPEDRPKMLALQRQLLAGEIPAFFLEKRYVRRDGSLIWVRVTGTVRRDAAGGAMQFVRLVEDINDRKRAEAELDHLLDSERAARSEAERASRMKDEFLATLSHELRTPLNAILGWSQILASGNKSEEDLAEGLKTIERNARAQTQIIEDLLDMSRIVSGKIRLDVQRLDLAAVVRSAVESLKPAAEAKGVRLMVVLDPLAGSITGDPSRLQQVMWNLLTNAVKFTPRGGRVQVLLERVNSHLEVSVIDTGEGISPDFLPHVFDRFRQSDASTTRHHGGLGLGLAIVKQLVELHGGTIRAKSPGPGCGSTFTFSLPLMPIHAEPEEATERRHPRAPGGATEPNPCASIHGLRVLVVDDEPDARVLMRRLLEDCGATVLVAATAAEAMRLLQAQRPDVLVSDIGLPQEDGYSLIRKIRALDPREGGSTPAIALTAYARAEDRMRAVMAGFQHHVAKPVEPAELITMVASLRRTD